MSLALPPAPSSIQKGVPLKKLLDKAAVEQLAHNIQFVHANFNKECFIKEALNNIQEYTLKERAFKIAEALKNHLPNNYSEVIEIFLASLTPPLEKTEDNGMAPMFYLIHICFIEKYGLNKEYNGGIDPFDISMKA
jgi:hypothetical protein